MSHRSLVPLRFALAALVLVVPLTATAGAPAPDKAGGEFLANTITVGQQDFPWIAADRRGNYVVVWMSDSFPGEQFWGILGQRFEADGDKIGSEFHVNTHTTEYQVRPSVARDQNGEFVVVWTSYGQAPDSDGYGIFAQRFDATGAKRGTDFLVNTYTTDWQGGVGIAGGVNPASVSMTPGGNFVVVWQSYNQNDQYYGVFGQRFDSSGTKLGAELHVNTVEDGDQWLPRVAVAPGGNFVVVWAGPDDSDYGIFAQRFDANGVKQGGEIVVNSFTTDTQQFPTVAWAPNGEFVVAWTSYGRAGSASNYDIAARRFSAAGTAVGAEFVVNTVTTNVQGSRYGAPSIKIDETGDFVVTWASYNEPGDGSSFGVWGRRYESNDTPKGPAFQINTTTTDFQADPVVTGDMAGNFVVAMSYYALGADTYYAAAGQRMMGLLPSKADVDPVGGGGTSDDNRVLEPGETVEVRPQWRNTDTENKSPDGTLSSISGPGSPAITDTSGDYDIVTPGEDASCLGSPCYLVSLTNPGTRPIFHWDIQAQETIAPESLGEEKLWVMHVGDSFTDVPRSNGFYREIEALFHHGVTSGTAIVGDRLAYSPAQNTTREQMAKFVLAAREGSNFAPRVCSGAEARIFADVPTSNGFCPWIEELFRRGVVNGCALSPLRYCPTNQVTREQMAKFVLVTLDPDIAPPACQAGSEVFTDVPASNGFCPFVEELFNRGVVSGCAVNPPRYCPTNPVTREQMARFLGRTFGLELYGP